jgi:REP element-mobilizing transposase RayT
VTQRGNRRQEILFEKDDYLAYLELTAEWCGQRGVGIWAYCLMSLRMNCVGNCGNSSLSPQ